MKVKVIGCLDALTILCAVSLSGVIPGFARIDQETPHMAIRKKVAAEGGWPACSCSPLRPLPCRRKKNRGSRL